MYDALKILIYLIVNMAAEIISKLRHIIFLIVKKPFGCEGERAPIVAINSKVPNVKSAWARNFWKFTNVVFPLIFENHGVAWCYVFNFQHNIFFSINLLN